MSYKTVNLETGLPTVREGTARLTRELSTARLQGVKVLKIIHGYGSSGTGGKLRVELRRYLAGLKAKREIKDLIPGEDFTIFNESTRKILPLSPEIGTDRDLNRYNNGVTLIVL